MTARADLFKTLVANAGPRVRAPQRLVTFSDDRARPRFLDEHLRVQSLTPSEAARVMVLQLRDDEGLLLPWSLDRNDPVRHLGWLVPLGIAIPLALTVAGAGWPWIAGAGAIAFIAGARLLMGLPRRVAVSAREVSAELEHGVPALELVDEIEALVQMAPEHDAARLLLALVRLQQDDALGALMQLAPLRDRHPDEGIVVLLAAIAYARLNAVQDAVRMLEALRVDPGHGWATRLQRFRIVCERQAVRGARASSDDVELDP